MNQGFWCLPSSLRASWDGLTAGGRTATYGRRLTSRLMAYGLSWLVAFVFARAVVADEVPIPIDGSFFVIEARPGMEPYAAQALDVVRESWGRVATTIGAPPGDTIRISIEYRFDDFFEREGLPSRPPEWAAGLAIPSLRVILLAPGNPTWRSTLEHEMAHVAVAIATGDRHVPVWFNEGMAVRVAEQWSLERAGTMVQAGGFHDFRTLERSFPAAKSPADLAYAQSFHLVRWATARWGEDLFRRVLERMRETDTTFEDAFLRETDTLLTVAYDLWANEAKIRYRWAPALMGGGLLGAMILLLIVTGWRRAVGRRREALRRLEARDGSPERRDSDDRTFGG